MVTVSPASSNAFCRELANGTCRYMGHDPKGPSTEAIARALRGDTLCHIRTDETFRVSVGKDRAVYVTRFTACAEGWSGKGFVTGESPSVVSAGAYRLFGEKVDRDVEAFCGVETRSDIADEMYRVLGDVWEKAHDAAQREAAAVSLEQQHKPCSTSSHGPTLLTEVRSYLQENRSKTFSDFLTHSLGARSALVALGASDPSHPYRDLLDTLREADKLEFTFGVRDKNTVAKIEAIVSSALTQIDRLLEPTDLSPLTCPISADIMFRETYQAFYRRLVLAELRELAWSARFVADERAPCEEGLLDRTRRLQEAARNTLRDGRVWGALEFFEQQGASLISDLSSLREKVMEALSCGNSQFACQSLGKILLEGLGKHALHGNVEDPGPFLEKFTVVRFRAGRFEPDQTAWDAWEQEALRTYKPKQRESWNGLSMKWSAEILRDIFNKFDGTLVCSFDSEMRPCGWILDLSGASKSHYVVDKLPLLREHAFEFVGSGYTVLTNSRPGARVEARRCGVDLYFELTEEGRDESLREFETFLLSKVRVASADVGENSAIRDHARVGWRVLPVVEETNGIASAFQSLQVRPSWRSPGVCD